MGHGYKEANRGVASSRKLRVAYFTPLQPKKSGISDYSEELLPLLKEYVDIDLFIDSGYSPSNPEILSSFEVFAHTKLEECDAQRGYDLKVYQMGNNSLYHEYMYPVLIKHPGITVLHDYMLHHLFFPLKDIYYDEMWEWYGRPGLSWAKEAKKGLRTANLFEYPLSNRVIESSIGIIVHSEFVAKKVRRALPRIPVRKINFHFSPPKNINNHSVEMVRKKLGFDTKELILGSFGFLTPEKRLGVSLRAFKKLREEYPASRYLLVGESSPHYNLHKLVKNLGLQQCTYVTGYVDMQLFQEYLKAVDICINLRFPTCGETSGSFIRMLGTGKPVITSDEGAFSEIPDKCCLKVRVDENEGETLLSHLRYLAADEKARKTLGRNARGYVQRHHSIESSARQYADFFHEVFAIQKKKGLVSRSKVRQRIDNPVLREVGKETAALTIKSDDRFILEELADVLKELILHPKER